MNCSYYTITTHIKGRHLLYEERVLIQIRLKDNYSIGQLSVRSAAHRALSRMKWHGVQLPCITARDPL